jgi:thiamine pyrophosphate-dependent acetolactate synthase large subunit-like protein
MKASEFIVDELMSLGIDKIFGVNGGLIEPFLLEAYNKNLEIVHCAS